MGNLQSTKRPTMHSLFPSSSDYTRLHSSPSRQPLLKEDYSEHYETALKDILKKNADNTKKITQLEQKVEYLEKLITSKTAAVEGSITKTTVSDKKINEQKHLVSAKKLTNETSIQENLANKKKVVKHVEKIEAELIAKNATREANMINLMDAEVDELTLMKLNHNQNNKHDEMDEPEYVNSLMGLILMLIFLVFISIGMQL